ncbi:MAG: hypothetical protein M5U09_30310 [Gammaproteobacteria bacterium]|nr:hypothetical protein [Gammaproteobacteria bacterium]
MKQANSGAHRLAHGDGTAAAQRRHAAGITQRHLPAIDGTAPARRHVVRVHDVLDPERYALKAAAVVRRRRVRQRLANAIEVDVLERLYLVLARFDAGDASIQQVGRIEIAAFAQADKFGESQFVQGGHAVGPVVIDSTPRPSVASDGSAKCRRRVIGLTTVAQHVSGHDSERLRSSAPPGFVLAGTSANRLRAVPVRGLQDSASHNIYTFHRSVFDLYFI